MFTYIHTYPIHIYIYGDAGAMEDAVSTATPCRQADATLATVFTLKRLPFPSPFSFGGVEFPDFQGDSLIFSAGSLNSSEFPGKPRTFFAGDEQLEIVHERYIASV
jgi:hypothetical protein